MVWERELSAGDIAGEFDVTWAAVSQNLRVLREAGLVLERRDGNHRLYRANHAALGPLERALKQMWQDDLARLRHLAEAEHRRGRKRA
jgi:DNA-binding transcriptional ArsR family regulator